MIAIGFLMWLAMMQGNVKVYPTSAKVTVLKVIDSLGRDCYFRAVDMPFNIRAWEIDDLGRFCVDSSHHAFATELAQASTGTAPIWQDATSNPVDCMNNINCGGAHANPNYDPAHLREAILSLGCLQGHQEMCSSEYEPMDVPAIQVTVPSEVVSSSLCLDCFVCSNGGHFENPKEPFSTKCVGGYTWSCAEKSRILLTAEDGSKHCIRF